MAREKITKRLVDAAESKDRDSFLWDRDVKGFGLKITPTGAKVYVLQYRMGGGGSATKRFTIGKHGSPWTPEAARERAKMLLFEVSGGSDPRQTQIARKRSLVEGTLEKLLPIYVERYAKANQERSWRETERIFRRDVLPKLGRKPVGDLTRAEIATFLEARACEAPAAARLTHALLRKFFVWCVDRGVIVASPMGEMRPPAKVQSRERVLDDHEVQVFWLACERLGDPWGTLFRLLLLTGQRREEVASVSWSDIAHDVWTIPAHRAKNGRTHLVPLSSEARKLLASYRERQGVRSGLVFTTTGTTPLSGFSKAKRRLDGLMSDLEERRTGEQKHQLTPWRTHDLRRTAATGFQKLGVRLEVTEAILNHVSGSRAGIVGVYQRYNWATEKAEALQRWSDHLVSLCGGNMESCNPIQKHLRVVA